MELAGNPLSKKAPRGGTAQGRPREETEDAKEESGGTCWRMAGDQNSQYLRGANTNSKFTHVTTQDLDLTKNTITLLAISLTMGKYL